MKYNGNIVSFQVLEKLKIHEYTIFLHISQEKGVIVFFLTIVLIRFIYSLVVIIAHRKIYPFNNICRNINS